MVKNTDDDGPGSLRYVINHAPAGATITFDPAVFNVERTILLNSNTLTIAQDLIIQGPGPNRLIIDGNYYYRPFTINSGVTATISGLTIQNGRAMGGAIYNSGVLTLLTLVAADNASIYDGGAIYNNGVLTVTLPKSAESKAKQITVKQD